MRDVEISVILRYIHQGWPTTETTEESFRPFVSRKEELSVFNDCILWGTRVVVPVPGRETILQELH